MGMGVGMHSFVSSDIFKYLFFLGGGGGGVKAAPTSPSKHCQGEVYSCRYGYGWKGKDQSWISEILRGQALQVV